MKHKLLVFGIVAIIFTSITAKADEGKNCYPITAKDLVREGAPRFDQYPAKVEQIRHPAKPKLHSHMARRYRTMLRRGVAEGPNFAGHYAVVVWGCGTDCRVFAVVNLKSGKVIFPDDFDAVVFWHRVKADDFEQAGASPSRMLRYKIDSRLLIVVGAINEGEGKEGAFYYLLQGGKLKRIFSVNVKKENCSSESQN
jgi:hypothetical protein